MKASILSIPWITATWWSNTYICWSFGLLIIARMKSKMMRLVLSFGGCFVLLFHHGRHQHRQMCRNVAIDLEKRTKRYSWSWLPRSYTPRWHAPPSDDFIFAEYTFSLLNVPPTIDKNLRKGNLCLLTPFYSIGKKILVRLVQYFICNNSYRTCPWQYNMRDPTQK